MDAKRAESGCSGFVSLLIAGVFLALCLPVHEPPDWRYLWGVAPFVVGAAVFFWRALRRSS
jgi:hypothetical protein